MLDVGLHHDGYQPELAAIADARTSDIAVGRSLEFSEGDTVAVGRGYNTKEYRSWST